jgi:hypothetical protein
VTLTYAEAAALSERVLLAILASGQEPDGSVSGPQGALPASLGQKTAAASLPVVQALGDVLTNRSGTITTGATAQAMMAANAARRYLLIQAPTTNSESFWINFTTTAVRSQPSIEVAPGVTFAWEGSFIPTEAISVIATTTGTPFVAKEG